MWTYFVLFVALYLVLLYVPGFIACRSMGLRGDLALLSGPVVSIACYSILFIAFGMTGVKCSLIPCFSTVLLILLVFYAVRRRFFAMSDFDGGITLSAKYVVKIALVYVAVGMLLCFTLFYRRFQDPSFMIQGFDTLFHVNLVRSFFDSQNFSSITASLYQSGLSPFSQPSGGFYPAAWHGLCALALSLNPNELNVAANALNFVFASVVFPSGIFLMLVQLFKKHKSVNFYITGAFLCSCLYAFPWAMLLRGEQFPQFSSFALLPLAVSSIVMAIDAKCWQERISFAVVSMFGCISLVLLQTSSIFAAFVFSASYLLHCIYVRYGKKGRLFAMGLVCLTTLLLGVFWIACYEMPFLRSIVEFEWESFTDIAGAIRNILLFSFSDNTPVQPLLTIALVFGLMDIAKNRRGAYLFLPWLFFALSYAASACSNGAYIKHILGGFWYTDPSRLSALTCIASVPILYLGANAVMLRLVPKFRWNHALTSFAFASMLCVAAIMVSFPLTEGISRSFNDALCADIDQQIGSSDAGIYSENEKEFVARVLEEVGDDSVIVNCPDDGSAFAYADDDANVLYRRNYADVRGESVESKIIRHNLRNIATNQSVQSIVERWNIGYVLLLSDSDGKGAFHSYKLEDWDGLQLIDDTTEGFELVDQQGDMRLYKVELSDKSS